MRNLKHLQKEIIDLSSFTSTNQIRGRGSLTADHKQIFILPLVRKRGHLSKSLISAIIRRRKFNVRRKQVYWELLSIKFVAEEECRFSFNDMINENEYKSLRDRESWNLYIKSDQ